MNRRNSIVSVGPSYPRSQSYSSSPSLSPTLPSMPAIDLTADDNEDDAGVELSEPSSSNYDKPEPSRQRPGPKSWKRAADSEQTSHAGHDDNGAGSVQQQRFKQRQRSMQAIPSEFRGAVSAAPPVRQPRLHNNPVLANGRPMYRPGEHIPVSQRPPIEEHEHFIMVRAESPRTNGA